MLFLFVLSSVLARFVFPPAAGQGGDLVDDLLAFYHWPGIRARFAGSFWGWMEKLAALPWVRAPIAWLNPRRHPWRAVTLVALGLGLALVTAEAIGEGVPNPSVIWLVLTLFITLEGSGVLLGYVLFGQYLGIFSGQGPSKEPAWLRRLGPCYCLARLPGAGHGQASNRASARQARVRILPVRRTGVSPQRSRTWCSPAGISTVSRP
jgi:hypothetical protein